MSNFGTAVFTAVLNNAQLIQASRTSATALAGISRAAAGAGRGLTGGLTVPIVAAAGIAVARSVQIENAWNEVRATYNETDFKKVEQAIRPHGELATAVDGLSQQYGLNRKSVIENLGTLSQMGYVGKQATGTLRQGLEFAVAAGIPLEEGLSTTVSLTNTFRLEGEKLTDALRGLNKVENDTAASGQDLTDGLRRAGGAAYSLVGPGFSASDAIGSIAGGMAVFKGAGQETMRSADALRAIFQRLYTTGPKVNALFEKMGVSTKDANGNLVPFPKLLGDIGANFDKLNRQEQLQFTKSAIGVEFGPLFDMLIKDVNKGNASLYKTAAEGFKDVKAGAAAYERELKIRGESMQAVIGRIGASFDKFIDSATPVIKSIVTPIANAIATWVDSFSKASPAVQRMVIIVGALIAVIGPLLVIIGIMSAAIGAISLPVIAVIAGIVALIAGIAMFIRWLNQGSDAANKIKAVLGFVAEVVKKYLLAAWGSMSDAIKNLLPILKVVGAVLGVVIVAAVVALAAAIRVAAFAFKVWTEVVQWVANFIVGIFKWIYDVLLGHSIIPDIVNGMKAWFQRGYDIVKSIFTAVKTFLANIWNGIKAVVDAAIGAVMSTIKTGLTNLKNNWTAVWTAIKTAVSTAWTGIKSVVSAAWKALADGLKTGWTNLKTNWSNAWTAIKTTVSNVWTGIKGIFKTFKDGLTSLGSHFGTVQRTIETAWGKVKESAAKPIRFVINTVLNNGLIRGFNAISGKIGGPKIPSISAGFSGGGFTGRGGKYTPAGIVHRGEVVWSQEDINRSGGVKAVETARRSGLPPYWGGGIVDWAKSAWDKVQTGVTSTVDFFKNIGGNLLPDLSGVGNTTLGQILKSGLGKLKDAAIRKLKSVFDMGGNANGAGMGWRAQVAWARRNTPWAAITSTVRTGNPASDHDKGRAIDLAGARMGDTFEAIKRFYKASSVRSLYFSPKGSRQIRFGRVMDTPPHIKTEHYDHVHWAMRRGGVVPGSGSGDRTNLRAEPGEFVLAKNVVRKIGLANLRRANNSRDPLAVLANAAGAPNARGLAMRANPAEFAPGLMRRLDATAITPGVGGARIELDHSGQTIGEQHFHFTINNPIAERASESTQERLRRSSALGLINSRTAKGD